MTNSLYYLITIIIWGTTWIGIQYQVESVDPLWSVVYRFGSASLILFIFCLLAGKSLYFSRKEHGIIMLQSIFLFSVNYILYYAGSQHLISGYVAITAATIAIMNIFNSHLFLKTPFNARKMLGAVIGVFGLVVVFWDEFLGAILGKSELKELMVGAILCLVATYVASLGNVISKHNQDLKLPVLQTNAWGMLYGTLATMIIALCMGKMPGIDWSAPYLLSLGYLSFFGTVIAFGTYLKLVGNIGPERAAYVFVLTPIVALVLSSFFEEFQWTLSTLIGIALILLGNILVNASTTQPAIQDDEHLSIKES